MTWCREPVLDEYEEGGELVVFLEGGRVLALSDVATAVLSVLREPGHTADVAERLNASSVPLMEGHGTQVLDSLLDELSDLGLIRAI